MRVHALLPALLIAASVSAQTVNTQLDGITLTNGLSSFSDTSAITDGANKTAGLAYLTDNDTLTIVGNIGGESDFSANGGSLQGNFGGAVPSSATGVYIVTLAIASEFNDFTPTNAISNGTFDVQLALLSGLSSTRNYSGESSFVITQQKISSMPAYLNQTFTTLTPTAPQEYFYAYLYIPFTDFGTSYSQVTGIRLSNMTNPFPDFSYIGLGYSGTPIPEPSTYGMILGGLALVGAAVRRRKRN